MGSINGEVTMHGAWHSPFCVRVRMVLKMKGVTYKYIEEDLKDKTPFLIENGGLVPILVHNGKPIVESIDIIDYIDRYFVGPPILPVDEVERAKLLARLLAIDEEAVKPAWNIYWKIGEESKTAKDNAIKGLTKLESEIGDNKFFGGDKIGIVDVIACYIAYGVPVLEELDGFKLMTEDKFPRLLKWIINYNNDPMAKEFFPPSDSLSISYKTGLVPDRYAFYKAGFLDFESRNRAKLISN